MIIVDFIFLLFLNNKLVYCRILTTFFVVVIKRFFRNRFLKSSLKNEQSMKILKIEFALLLKKYAP